MTTSRQPDDRATATLLISCPDQRGIVAAVAACLLDAGANIDLFLQRIEFEQDGIDVAALEAAFAPIADAYAMDWSLRRSDSPMRVAILTSRDPHCLTDLLSRWQIGELRGTPVAVVSNHPDHAGIARHHGVPFHHLPIAPGERDRQEATMLDLLDELSVDLVILARYMQILSPAMVDRYPNRIINIHHSFLPAFAGARPYHQAHDRGVKIIGATAHYVTADLDEGPIIDQDVANVSHRDEIADLIQKGRDLEKVVLARAVRAHLDHRILSYRNRTVVFR